MSVWALSVIALVACHTRNSSVEKHVDASAPDVHDAAPSVTGACHVPGPGELSDDESPAITKLPESTEILPWLAARGVTEAAAKTWYVGRFAPHVDKSDADLVLDNASGKKLVVGDKREDALVIEHMFRWGWTPEKVLVLTVRNKRIVVLLDVGIRMSAMDWPGTHHLDLALDIDPSGMKMVLRDRAPDGTKLVEPPSVCRERIAHVAQPGEPVPVADMLAGLADYPGALTDCAHAVPYFQREVRAMAKSDPDALKAVTWIEKTCAERGTWNWKGERFVKAP